MAKVCFCKEFERLIRYILVYRCTSKGKLIVENYFWKEMDERAWL
jgi:hypothetical protein